MEENKATQTEEGKGAENELTLDKETYTKEEMTKLLQAESDRRVSSAMKKAEKQKQAAIEEAARLTKMSEEEKRNYEFEQREKKLADAEKSLRVQENKVSAMKIMADKGIPASLVDFIVAEDADDTMANIRLFEKEIQKAVSEEVKKRLAGSAPKAGTTAAEITKETFKKMTLAQRNDLYKSNPDLFRELSI